MRVVTQHIIQCSDSETGDVSHIRRWHLQRGWRDVGYHFIIRRDGEIEVGRQLNEVGSHCMGHNADSIGTCLIGKSSFAPAQFAALNKLHAGLRELFPNLTAHGHRDFQPAKTCPNFEVNDVLTKV